MTQTISLKKQVEMYIDHCHRLGYTDGNTTGLKEFIAFVDQKGHVGPLTITLAMEWATASKTNRRSAWARRLGLLHRFAKYCKAIEPKTEIPPSGIYGSTLHRPTPHIYTSDEIHHLMMATKLMQSTNGLKPIVFKYLIGLLASTGLRISEAIKLTDNDVDLINGVLTINESKARKSRYIPLHPTTINALKEYVLLRNTFFNIKPSNFFFINDKGNSLSIISIDRDYRWLREKVGLKNNPRLYDLRHTFACNRLLKWYEEEKNIDEMIVYLSTYLGHGSTIDTYWYLTATPELFSIVTKRFEKFTHCREGGSL